MLGTEYPIIQSGMSGVAGPELAAEVCNAGGLGVLAGLLVGPDALRAAIDEIRSRTDRPFGVNLLLLPEIWDPQPADQLDTDLIARVHAVADRIRHDVGLEPLTEPPPTIPQLVDAALDVIVEERVPVFSAGLGDPGPDVTSRLHDAGIRTVVMVTNADDARRVAASGADVVVAQGAEAGGHRSHLEAPTDPDLDELGTFALLQEVVGAVDVPVVAAGGVVDGRGLVAALALGASGVLMGSRFLVSRESSAPEAHKKRLLEASGDETIVTAGLSGRQARAVRNRMTDAWAGVPDPLPFPAQYIINTGVYDIGDARHDADLLPLWGGQGVGRLDDLPWAADVVAATVDAAAELIRNRVGAEIDG